MQPLRLNVERSFWEKVNVVFNDEDGNPATGSFLAKYRIANSDETKAEENSKKTLLELVLLDVKHLELYDKDNELLKGEDLLHAAKIDPVIGNALVRTYGESVQKKPQR